MRSYVPRKKGLRRSAGLVVAITALTVAGLVQGASASTLSQGGSAAANAHTVVAKAAVPLGLPGVPNDSAFKQNLRVMLYRSYLPSSGSQKQIVLPKLSLKNTTTGVVTPLPTCGGFATGADRFVDTRIQAYNMLSSLFRTLTGPRISQFPYCGWWLVVDRTHTNIFFPDENAAYWAAPFLAGPDQELLIDGVYPDNRYMTLTLYNADSAFYTFNGRTSIIHDFEILPNRGSKNPWRTLGAAPGGSWRVVAKPNPGPNEPNTLPSMPNPPVPITGRIFAPTPPCGNTTEDPSACRIPMMFAREVQALQGSVWSNPDNAYLSADNVFLPGAGGEVTVVRGKLPVTVHGRHPAVWPNNRAYQMRYMSFCIYPWVVPYPIESAAACAFDDQVVTDKQGFYTFVFSTKLSRPANATTANGVNWIQAVPRANNLLVMRNMLPSSNFRPTAANAPKNGNWISSYQVMGAYYPVSQWVCSKQIYEASGVAGCNPTGPPSG